RSAKTGGTGLGLAIVKHILQRYEARLDIESRPGVGSTFCCHFPTKSVGLRHDR
ncbi:MAG: ATP-binding protein, partial [Nitrococcus sp.]|nr:ATP-binding protein [Nitrococcus sp.]